MSRQERKLEHLQSILGSKPSSADFSEITLIHNCLPEIGLNSLDMTTAVAGIKLPFPLFINALTGGVSDAESINAKLAEAAAECGLPLAVGSQMAALEIRSTGGRLQLSEKISQRHCICQHWSICRH